MTTELEVTLARITSKTSVLLEKYRSLAERNAELSRQLESMEQERNDLRARLEQALRDKEYLTLSHTIAPSADDVHRAQIIVSRLVRDIDRCISQLKS